MDDTCFLVYGLHPAYDLKLGRRLYWVMWYPYLDHCYREVDNILYKLWWLEPFMYCWFLKFLGFTFVFDPLFLKLKGQCLILIWYTNLSFGESVLFSRAFRFKFELNSFSPLGKEFGTSPVFFSNSNFRWIYKCWLQMINWSCSSIFSLLDKENYKGCLYCHRAFFSHPHLLF